MRSSPRQTAYAWYLRSTWWQKRRQFIIERAKGRCEKAGCKNKATEVHHLNYMHVFNELPTDLIALCRRCHKDIHRLKPANDNQLSFSFAVPVKKVSSG